MTVTKWFPQQPSFPSVRYFLPSPSSYHLLRFLSLSLSLSEGLSRLCHVNKKAISPSYLHPYNLDLPLTYSDLCEFLFLFPSVCDGTFAIRILSFSVPSTFPTHPSSFLYDQLQKYLTPQGCCIEEAFFLYVSNKSTSLLRFRSGSCSQSVPFGLHALMKCLKKGYELLAHCSSWLERGAFVFKDME